MERIKTFRQGRIWLNVFLDDRGDLVLTFNKSLRAKEGGWKKTSFFRPKYSDVWNLMAVLKQFTDFERAAQKKRWEG